LKLGVNVDHIATVRQQRGGFEPDPVKAALVCQKAGAHSIVMHLREDRRHVQDKDLFRAKRALSIPLNMEMSIAPSVVAVAMRVVPDQVTLVPEKRRERTTEGGLDLFRKSLRLKRVIEGFKKKGVTVSLFIEPDLRQTKKACDLGADAVEFHTGAYANKKGAAARAELKRVAQATALALRLGLAPHAGHGLDYENVKPLKKIKGLQDLNIGYSIVSRALWSGLDRSVRDMLALIRQ
jgi:pyridoxine 5-phosphate synthase